MIVLCRTDLTPAQRDRVVALLATHGFECFERSEGERTVIEAPPAADACRCEVETLPGVERVFAGEPGAHLATRDHRAEPTRVAVGDVVFGGGETVIIGGPCAVESADVVLEIARAVRSAGGVMLRGGAYKPRTSPYYFRGLGEDGLRILADARAETGLPVVTEVMDTRDVELVERYADMFQIGSRNMHNFALLAEVGQAGKPVLLKRGMCATLDELLTSAEYVLAGGNEQVVLCERGIRTFEHASRNTLDLTAVPLLRERTHLPVVVDPSHASGKRSLVPALGRAAAAAGADGIIVEVHVRPEEARCDAKQAIVPAEFERLVDEIRAIDSVLRPVPALGSVS
jgi:3-deoxy-7-phosphoheptulonate synthase